MGGSETRLSDSDSTGGPHATTEAYLAPTRHSLGLARRVSTCEDRLRNTSLRPNPHARRAQKQRLVEQRQKEFSEKRAEARYGHWRRLCLFQCFDRLLACTPAH